MSEELHKAAMEYGAAKAAQESAIDSGIPWPVVASLRSASVAAGQSLLDAAVRYFDDNFDGAPAE